MKNAEQRLEWAMGICQKAKMRLTPMRQRMLEFLATNRSPVSLEAVTQTDGIRGCCNATTVYRTLMLFKELEVIRQVSLPNKISYFVLNIPNESSHFLICRRCGQILELPGAESISTLEREVAASRGYANLYHELEFFGVCPTCQKQPARVICAKLPVRTPVQ
jgi:Fur family ferric uptake transcriptional regulator